MISQARSHFTMALMLTHSRRCGQMNRRVHDVIYLHVVAIDVLLVDHNELSGGDSGLTRCAIAYPGPKHMPFPSAKMSIKTSSFTCHF